MEMQICKCRTMHWASHNGREIEFRCKCGKSVHHEKMSREMRKQYRDEAFAPIKQGHIHWLWHKIERTLLRKFKGWELICKMEQMVEKYPEIIQASVDDDAHAGSYVFYIPHQDKYEVWGITVLYVPQCTGEDPIRYFLYPGHLVGMIDALDKVADLFRKKGNKKIASFWENPKKPKLVIPNIKKPKELQPKYSKVVLTAAQEKKRQDMLKSFEPKPTYAEGI